MTNVVKQAEIVKDYKGKSGQEVSEIEKSWATVLRWELEASKPKLVVAMGKKPAGVLKRLERFGLIELPTLHGTVQLMEVPHYAYIGQRADAARRLGPMHPIRVAEYEEEFRAVRERWAAIIA